MMKAPRAKTAVLLLCLVAIAAMPIAHGVGQDKGKLRFGVGPLQPTPTETKKAYEPFFAYLAKQLDRDFDLVATTDWAGISVALANKQVDLAWMGPWGYILANDDSGVRAIATAKYDGKPIYHAIVVCEPGAVKNWPEGGKGKRVSFADVGSTSGWLIPTAWFKSKGIDPKEYFNYSDGATHAANEIAVASGQVDCATDFDRNRNAMIEGGQLEKNATEVVWQSDPLPNDAIAVPKDFDPALAERIQKILVGITDAQAKTILPNHYTGFVAGEPRQLQDDRGRRDPRRAHQEEVDGRRAGDRHRYPEPALPWGSGRRLRFVLILLLLTLFYAVSWHLAQVDPGKLLTGPAEDGGLGAPRRGRRPPTSCPCSCCARPRRSRWRPSAPRRPRCSRCRCACRRAQRHAEHGCSTIPPAGS